MKTVFMKNIFFLFDFGFATYYFYINRIWNCEEKNITVACFSSKKKFNIVIVGDTLIQFYVYL